MISPAQFKMYFMFYSIDSSEDEEKQKCLKNIYKLKKNSKTWKFCGYYCIVP